MDTSSLRTGPRTEERRRVAREIMMDEDEQTGEGDSFKLAGRAGPAQAKRRRVVAPNTPPRSTHASSSPSSSSPRLAIKFAGKIYRTLDTHIAGVSYSPQGNFFGEPDEEVGDARRERGEQRRKEVERDMLRSGGKTQLQRSVVLDSDDELDVRGNAVASTSSPTPLTPTKRRTVPQAVTPPSKLLFGSLGARPTALGLPFSTAAQGHRPTRPLSSKNPLPPALADLLGLHTALESVLLFHLANEGSRVASSTSRPNRAGEATIRMTNLIDLPELVKMVMSSGRRFGEKELSKLLWVWEGCGLGEGTNGVKIEDDEDVGLEIGAQETGGMGFLVTRTRCGTASNVITTYGLGISVTVRTNPQLPKFELVAPTTSPSRTPAKMVAPPSPSSIGKGRDGMSVVALWSQGNELRREEFHKRLREWGRRCVHEEHTRSGSSATPPTHEFPTTMPEIPRATLPSLAPAVPCVPGTTSPSPKKSSKAYDVFGPVIPIAAPNGSLAVLFDGHHRAAPAIGSAKDRKQAMLERVRAKEDARRPSAYMESRMALSEGTMTTKKSLRPDRDVGTTWRIEQQERYKRNAMISRLGSVADGVWMLFDLGRRRSILLFDVATAIAKSSKISLSLDEAQASLLLLLEICPEFVSIKTVDHQEWLSLKGDPNYSLKDVKEAVRLEREKAAQLAQH